MAGIVVKKAEKNIDPKDVLEWLKVAGCGVAVTTMILAAGYSIGWYVGYGVGVRDVLLWAKVYDPEAFLKFAKQYPKLVANLKLS